MAVNGRRTGEVLSAIVLEEACRPRSVQIATYCSCATFGNAENVIMRPKSCLGLAARDWSVLTTAPRPTLSYGMLQSVLEDIRASRFVGSERLANSNVASGCVWALFGQLRQRPASEICPGLCPERPAQLQTPTRVCSSQHYTEQQQDTAPKCLVAQEPFVQWFRSYQIQQPAPAL